MPSTYLARLARDFGWQPHDEVFAGEAQGCLLTAAEERGVLSLFFYLPDLDEATLASIETWLEQNSKRFRIAFHEYTDDYLLVRLTKGLVRISDEKLTRLLLLISNLAAEGQGSLSTRCAVCGRPAGKNERGFYLGLYSYGHSECFRQQDERNSQAQNLQDPDKQENPAEAGDSETKVTTEES